MILIVGAGPMAVQYANVLKALGQPFQVVGRSAQSAETFHAAVGVMPCTGGIEAYFNGEHPAIQSAIVAVSIEQLEYASTYLLDQGVKRLLVEKPGALTLDAIERLKHKADAAGATVYIAYNRRFLSSVLKARELIKEDGGVTSFNFEITEWSTIQGIPKAEGVKENWFFGNTTHVTDLAFYLGGRPRQLSTFTAGSGSLPWHSRAARFCGAGETHEGALFSYSGDWEAPGRWVVEILTKKRRFIFKPLETLQVQLLNSVAVTPVELDTTLDTQYKPGFYRQVEHFLTDNEEGLCTLAEHLENSRIYARIANYM